VCSSAGVHPYNAKCRDEQETQQRTKGCAGGIPGLNKIRDHALVELLHTGPQDLHMRANISAGVRQGTRRALGILNTPSTAYRATTTTTETKQVRTIPKTWAFGWQSHPRSTARSLQHTPSARSSSHCGARNSGGNSQGVKENCQAASHVLVAGDADNHGIAGLSAHRNMNLHSPSNP
jgi:hypothetical protein